MKKTVTDKPNFSVTIQDKARFSGLLTDEEREMFEFVRNSMLEIMPSDNGKFTEEAINAAENFAFIHMQQVSMLLRRIETLEKSVGTQSSTRGE